MYGVIHYAPQCLNDLPYALVQPEVHEFLRPRPEYEGEGVHVGEGDVAGASVSTVADARAADRAAIGS